MRGRQGAKLDGHQMFAREPKGQAERRRCIRSISPANLKPVGQPRGRLRIRLGRRFKSKNEPSGLDVSAMTEGTWVPPVTNRQPNAISKGTSDRIL